jgi:hypothetical protein
MGRHEERAQSAGEHQRPYKPLGWKFHLGMIAAAAFFLFNWLHNQQTGHFVWTSFHNRTPVFNAGLVACGAISLIIGLIPWDWLNRRARAKVRRKPEMLPRRHRGKV